MINPNDFIFNSEFNYMPTMASGSAPKTGDLTLLSNSVTGIPLVHVRSEGNGQIVMGAPFLDMSVPPAIIRNGKLYADTGFSDVTAVSWRMHGT